MVLNRSLLKKQLGKLFGAIVAAKLYFGVYRVFTNEIDHPKFVDIMKYYFNFFSPSISAHFVATIMALSKIFDNKNVSIYTLVKNISSLDLDKVDQEKLKALQDKVQSIRPQVEKVLILRNNVYAHISKGMNTLQAFKESNITPNDLRDLIEKAMEALGDAGELIDGITMAEFEPSEADTRAVLVDLKKYREYETGANYEN